MLDVTGGDRATHLRQLARRVAPYATEEVPSAALPSSKDGGNLWFVVVNGGYS